MSAGRFEIKLRLGNDAMLSFEDVAEALEKTAAKLRDYENPPSPGEGGRILDRNGLSVGTWGFGR